MRVALNNVAGELPSRLPALTPLSHLPRGFSVQGDQNIFSCAGLKVIGCLGVSPLPESRDWQGIHQRKKAWPSIWSGDSSGLLG